MLTDEELAEARHKLAAGRIYATRQMPYFTTALMAMSPTERIGLGTFAVDERWRLYYDPLKCLEWSVKEITAAWLHEVGHLIRNHNARFKELEGYNHDHAIFNAACDAAINSDLREMSILLPNPELRYYAEPNPNFPKWKKGMTAEQMYFIGRGNSAGNASGKDAEADSTKDNQENSQEKPNESEPQNSPQKDPSQDPPESNNASENNPQDESAESVESKESDSESKESSAKDDSSDESSSESSKSDENSENKDSDHPDDDSESAGTEHEDESKNESGDEEPSESKDGSQDSSPDEATDEHGSGDSENSDELGEDGEGSEKSSESSGSDDGDDESEGDITLEDGEGSGNTHTEDGDTGGDPSGEVLSGESGMPLPDCGSAVDGIQRDYEETNDNDGSIDKTSAESIKKDTARAILDYANSHPGSVPGSLVREAENILDPQVDWQDEFSALVRHIAASHSGYTNYSYQRPSRRSAGHSFIMPSMRNPPAPEIAIILDTSGSMDEKKELALGLAEMEEIINRSARNSVSQSIKIINCDSAAATVEVVRDLKDFEIIGGGGTDMRVGIKAAAEIKPKVDIIIVVTDGFTPWPVQIPDENPRAFYVALIVGRGERRGEPKVPDWMKVITVNIPQKRKGYTIRR